MNTPSRNSDAFPLSHLLINLTAVLLWLVAAAGLALGKINSAGRSGFIGVLMGVTFSWLILSPFFHQTLHKRILRSGESGLQDQALVNLRFALLFAIAAVTASAIFAWLHQTFLVVMK